MHSSSEAKDFSEIFNERIRGACTGSQAGGGKTISAQQIFEALHGWNNRMQDRRGRRGTRNQGLHVAPVVLGLPVARLSRWRTFSVSC
jgi:hypothetical protein